MAVTRFYGVISESDVNVLTNTSNVTVSLYISWNYGSFARDDPAYSITINGTTLTGTANFNADEETNGSGVFVVSGAATVEHELNGTKEVSCSAWYEGQRKGEGAVYTWSGKKTLTTIPRASNFGVIDDFVVENAFAVPVTKFASSFYDVLTVKYGNTVVATREGYINGSVALSASELLAAYSAMSAVISGAWTFELVTYSDGSKTTQIGSTQAATATATIGEAGRSPTWGEAYISATDVNPATLSLTGSPTIFISGYSILRVTLSNKASANKGAALGAQAYRITSGAKAPVYKNQDDTFPATADFTSVNNNQFSAAVTDGRGATTMYTKNIDLRAYETPKIASFAARRENLTGTSVSLDFGGTISGFGEGVTTQNSVIEAKYRFKELPDGAYGNYTNIAVTSDGFSYSFDTAISGTFDATKNYQFEVTVTDRLDSSVSTTVLKSAAVIVDIDAVNRRVGIGKILDDSNEDSLILEKPLGLSYGGLGSTNAAEARTNLGLGDFATKNTPLGVADGGTGATSALSALSALGGLSMTKVWETATPNANFVSGTISMDLSSYDLALVMFFSFPNEHHVISSIVPVDGGMGVVYFSTTQMGGGTDASRRFVVNTTGITFDAYYNYSTQQPSATGDALVPFRVYGINGIQTI